MTVPEANNSATVGSNYTNLHLSAISFEYPPAQPAIAQCKCEEQPSRQGGDHDQKHIRVYRNEPSPYGYNQGCYVIKESRYSTLNGWHAPTDDLVADDAASGSPVAATGWWEKSGNSKGSEEVWQTRVYYVSNDGTIRERSNRSHFAPIAKEDFEYDLPKPEEMVVPTPGWKLTELRDSKVANSQKAVDTALFPKVVPLASTKLAAVHSDDGSIHVIYQAKDGSVRELLYSLGNGWKGEPTGDNGLILGAKTAQNGTPLTAVAGGWSETRVFCVDRTNQVLEVHSNDHVKWDVSPTPYNVKPTAMLAAVASNFASPFFEMRLYTAADNDDLHECSFSRRNGGWVSAQGISSIEPDALPAVKSPLSAVAATLVPGEWTTKVYFHPRRTVIAEWDICAKDTAHAGVTKVSAGARMRRDIEEETRAKIAEEKRRKEEEERRAKEQERKKKEEKERQAQSYKKVAVGGTVKITDEAKLKRVQAKLNCASGLEFVKITGGWQCTGGAHRITDAEFDAA
ncbi:hypothetical protein CC80DRAFT_489953 [Byssothecium circinans]|uniref:Uncharacterized protein n=1 Tax=Byssothecium circinans TaxID=147558 RepID=A0A6A5U4Y4_9PLEO|nr:hypothetical protein CC80DRAFT_489953 [Byssothecium circinans]